MSLHIENHYKISLPPPPEKQKKIILCLYSVLGSPKAQNKVAPPPVSGRSCNGNTIAPQWDHHSTMTNVYITDIEI
jgi:hypothetical protein